MLLETLLLVSTEPGCQAPESVAGEQPGGWGWGWGAMGVGVVAAKAMVVASWVELLAG